MVEIRQLVHQRAAGTRHRCSDEPKQLTDRMERLGTLDDRTVIGALHLQKACPRPPSYELPVNLEVIVTRADGDERRHCVARHEFGREDETSCSARGGGKRGQDIRAQESRAERGSNRVRLTP